MNLHELVAYCGLTCKSCPIYWASREQDLEKQKKMRVKIAQLCNEHYDSGLEPEDITDCDGCRTDSERLFSGCIRCEIRKCARERKYKTCAECPEYICHKLENLYIIDPTGKMWLEVIRSTL